MAVVSERLSYRQVAKLYGTRPQNVAAMAARGEIPYHRTEYRGDRLTYVFLRPVIEADLRRRGELAAERAVAS